jgi:hypothetical protein
VARDPGEFRELAPYAAAADEGPRGRGRGSSARIASDVPEMRPRRVGELLDVATEIFRARFALYVGLAVLLWLPVYVLRPLLVPDDWLARDAPSAAGAMLGGMVTLSATLVVTAFVNATVARLVAAELGGAAISVGVAVRGVLARFFSIAVLAIGNGLATAAGFLCLCVPGFLVLFKVYLAPAICVIEDAGVVRSLERSAHLSRDRFGAWLGLFVTAALLLFPFSSMPGVFDQPAVRESALHRLGVPVLAYDGARVAFSALFMGVATAFQGILVTVWYFDGLVRRDGADLAVRLERLRAAEAA